MKLSPQRYCREICRKSESNFLHAARFLKGEQRDALEAFYAFCKLVDDAADEAPSKDAARKAISEWRLELDRISVSKPTHPVGLALAPHLKHFHVPIILLEKIINGCSMDIDKETYETFSELELYAYRVASCVGLVAIRIFGIPPHSQNEQTAVAMGKALQLTNILRDVAEDFERGRVYLPQEDLRRCNVSFKDLERKRWHEGMQNLYRLQIERARGYFKTAFDGIMREKQERRKWLPALLMGRVYESILDRIHDNPRASLQQRCEVSAWQKLRSVGKTLGELYLS